MKLHETLLAALLLSAPAASAAGIQDLPAAFSKLKTLVGEWEANTSMGKGRLSYELIGGGTALVERFSSEKHPVMVTVYHLDNGRLLLTHYCSAGNQPRMQAARYDAATGEFDFRFLDATNLPNPKTGHMHNAKFRLVDANRMHNEWQFYEDEKLKFTEASDWTRVR